MPHMPDITPDSLLQQARANKIPTNLSACRAALLICDCLAASGRGRYPVLFGVNGAQGSGKSTMSSLIALALDMSSNAKAAILSLDDFYHTREMRQHLSDTVHPLCLTRGVPGTHDTILLMRTLSLLMIATDRSSTSWPAFSKLTDDRLPEKDWRRFDGRPDAILLEGWCVGFPADCLPDWTAPINELEASQDAEGRWASWSRERLAADYTGLWKMLDGLATISLPDMDSVVQSRLKQELGLKTTEGPRGGEMKLEQVRRFVAHYERYTRAMWRTMPAIADIAFVRDAEFNYAVQTKD